MGFCRLMKRRLGAARAFSWHDWYILGQAWVLLGMVDLGLRLLPFWRVQQWLARRGGSEPVAAPVLDTMQRVSRLVSLAAHCHVHPMRCLPQALVLQWLLGRQGIYTELRIGVRKEGTRLYAHAWLEYEGLPLGEPPEIATHFAPLVAAEAGQ